MASCRTGKKATRIKHTVDSLAAISSVSPEAAVISPEKQQLIQTYSPLWTHTIPFSTFSGKARCHYEQGQNKQDFTANIRIKKDEVIWVSVNALGGIVQVARMMITPDSFRLVNYIKSEIMEIPLAEAIKILPVPADFFVLQRLLMGHVLKPVSRFTDAADTGENLSLQGEGEDLYQEAVFQKQDSTLRFFRMQTVAENGPSGTIVYTNYAVKDNRKFSMTRAIQVQNAGISYLLEMDFTSAYFDQAVSFPFSVPKHYERK